MADEITPLIGMRLPTPGVTKALGVAPPGESWMELQNAAMRLLDSHSHAPGYGRPVPSSGINVNAALPFNGNDATQIRSVRLADQGAPLTAPADVGCVFRSGGELYYRDASGNVVQITSGGALNAASIGAIGGDYATSSASEFYTSASQLFSFESSSGVKAGIAAGPLQLFDPIASGKKVTVRAPSGLSADYQLTMPTALPGSTRLLSLDSSGNVAATAYDAANVARRNEANTFSAGNTFSTSQTLSAGDWTLSQAATQKVTKSGGTLQVGTSDSNDVEFLRAAVRMLGLTAAGVDANNSALINIGRAHFQSRTSDPTTPSDGNLWYRSDTDKFRGQVNGATQSLATEAYVDSSVTSSPSQIALTLGTNWASSVGPSYYGKKAGWVYATISAVRWDGATGIPGTPVATLPSGHWPPSGVAPVRVAVYNATAGGVVLGRVSNNGDILIETSVSHLDVLHGIFVFPAA